MTKLNPPAAVPTYDDLFPRAVETVSAFARVTPGICEELGVGAPELVLALLLYAGQLSRTLGGKKKDFERAAGAAFEDSADIFTVGQEKTAARTDDTVIPPARAVSLEKVVETLRMAAKLVEQGWVQGEQAMKWIKAKTEPGGKKLVNCLVKDPYASRWSLIGAIDAAAPDEVTRVLARDVTFRAIEQSGFKFAPGSLVPTVLVDYNDYGMEGGARETPEDKPDGPPRTRDEVLAILDAAARWASEPVRGEEILDTDPVDPGEGLEP